MKVDDSDSIPEAPKETQKPTLSKHKSYDSIASMEDEKPKEMAEIDVLAKAIHEIDLNLEPKITPSFYYYKRWLWIAFPWLCLQPDKRYNYSSLIYECYSSNLKYLSVSDDMLLTECRNRLPRLHQDR